MQSRKDSQGICFLGKLKFEDFVGHHLGENPGVVRDFHTNEELGEHKGLWFHTIGQRKGLGEATKKWVVHLLVLARGHTFLLDSRQSHT